MPGVIGLLLISAVIHASPEIADAARTSDHALIHKLLQAHADVNSAQADGMTALHWAAYLDDVDTTRLLLKAGANVKATNHYGVLPLSLACQNGNTEIVELLLAAGADANTTLRGGETALMTAARTGKIGPVKALLARGADANAKERRGQTALMWAAADGHADVVQALLKAGADQTTLENSGFTPLFFAVREGRAEAAQVLLAAGADVNATMHPKRPTGRGVKQGTSPLILAVENGHFELALKLVDAGADPNDDRTGFTALHTLTWVRKPNRGDGDEDLPPPIGSGKVDSLLFVRELVKRGAEVNARVKNGKGGPGVLNKKGATPFFMAASTGDAPLMKVLFEVGADPLLPNVDNATPLMATAGLGTLAPGEQAGTEDECLEALQFTLDHGGDVNGVDNNGETAMHGTAYKEFPRMVQFLVDQGAKIDVWNRTNKWGWTPLRIAQGYRPGNFRPSAEMIEAIERVMRTAGVKPPENEHIAENKTDYAEPPKKKSAL